MKKILVFPTWIMMVCMNPFLKKSHPFKKRKLISLKEWSVGSTEFNNMYSLSCWICGIGLLLLVYLTQFHK